MQLQENYEVGKLYFSLSHYSDRDGIEIPRPKKHDIEKRRQISHDIVIPRRFLRGQKATTKKPQHRDSKTKKPRHRDPVEF